MITIYFLIILSLSLLSVALLLWNKKTPQQQVNMAYLPAWLIPTRWLCERLAKVQLGSFLIRKQNTHYNLVIGSAGMSPVIKSCDIIILKYILVFSILLVSAYISFLITTHYQFFIFATLLAIVLFYNLPDFWLKYKTIGRRDHFIRHFPFFLDLIVLSIKAGLTFSASIDIAVKKIPVGPLQSEFNQVLFDIRTGMSRRQALDSLAQRVNMTPVTSFVCVVNQLEVTGGEMGAVLSVQAKHTRTERFLRAEKIANQAPVKMLFPLIGLLFPITLFLILLPVYIRSKESGVFNLLF